jgi:hypothetical protein
MNVWNLDELLGIQPGQTARPIASGPIRYQFEGNPRPRKQASRRKRAKTESQDLRYHDLFEVLKLIETMPAEGTPTSGHLAVVPETLRKEETGMERS